MNKSELIEIISEKTKLPKKKAEETVNLVFDSMTNALTRGDRIEIRGFGSFVNREYESYTGRNPRTGESITVKNKRLPFFKVGKELREMVDNAANLSESGMEKSTSKDPLQSVSPGALS